MLFKGGDVCDVMLSIDPALESARPAPGKGDFRLSFALLDGAPVAVIYQPKTVGPMAPQRFASPTGAEDFDRVERLPGAVVEVERRDDGYTLDARVPLSDLGLVLKPDLRLRGDLGVLFSAGGRTVLRHYYANRDTSTVEDIPTEARLAPHLWCDVEVTAP